MFELCASILAANFACLKREVRAAESAGGDVSYIDIMDGHFVSAIAFGTGIVPGSYTQLCAPEKRGKIV